jgi:hypothetical protein
MPRKRAIVVAREDGLPVLTRRLRLGGVRGHDPKRAGVGVLTGLSSSSASKPSYVLSLIVSGGGEGRGDGSPKSQYTTPSASR